MKQRAIDINSNDNTLFVTAQCNNNCIMCCQPPTERNDIDFLYRENLDRIHHAPKDLPLLGITGGEPTLLGEKLVSLIKEIRNCLPDTEIQLLSNGRLFANRDYVKAVAEVANEKLYVGIELHSDFYKDHDAIAGAKGAYKETIHGLYNLTLYGVPIELRIIVCKRNYKRLPEIAQFIHRNLPFVGWIAFMGIEHVGYAVKNQANVWIEPKEYQNELLEAVKSLSDWNYDVSVFNIPLCLLPGYLHDFARKSISDWKNKYLPMCENCALKGDCCGFFTTSQRTFEGVQPFKEIPQYE